jgi:hypothetical protein
MLRLIKIAVPTIGCFLQAATASARTLAPTAGWVVDYRTDQCLATREYGTPDKPVTFGIRPAPNGETYLLFLARKHLGPNAAAEQQATVDFGKGSIKSWFLEYQAKPSDPDVYQFRISAAEMEQAKAAATAKLSPNNAPDVELQLGSMPALMKTLEDCTADLKNYWNMGAAKDGRVATSAKGDVRTLFSSDDYPAEAFSRSQGGKSQFILLVDETGDPPSRQIHAGSRQGRQAGPEQLRNSAGSLENGLKSIRSNRCLTSAMGRKRRRTLQRNPKIDGPLTVERGQLSGSSAIVMLRTIARPMSE